MTATSVVSFRFQREGSPADQGSLQYCRGSFRKKQGIQVFRKGNCGRLCVWIESLIGEWVMVSVIRYTSTGWLVLLCQSEEEYSDALRVDWVWPWQVQVTLTQVTDEQTAGTECCVCVSGHSLFLTPAGINTVETERGHIGTSLVSPVNYPVANNLCIILSLQTVQIYSHTFTPGCESTVSPVHHRVILHNHHHTVQILCSY